MIDKHRKEALEALEHFRTEMIAADLSQAKLTEILAHLNALEEEVKNPEPQADRIAAARTYLEDLTQTPPMTEAIAKIVRFFNSIGL